MNAVEDFAEGQPKDWPHVLARPEVRIAAIYLVFACLWVVCSDHIVNAVLPDAPVPVQTLKGVNFVITTSVVLFFVLRRAYRGWRQAERERWALLSEMSDRFRCLSARVERLREADRTRISRELHDQLGQALTGLKMDLRWIEGRLEQRDDSSLNPLTDRLVDAEEQVQGLIGTVQAIAADLRPDALDHLGLPEALLEEAERFQERTGIVCEVDARKLPEKVAPEAATAAFRIFQEAMTNVARHAEAKHVSVACRAGSAALTLTVADDGKGVPQGVEEASGSLGLLGMRERAELLGGHFHITTPETGGTRVTAVLPWKGT